MMSITGSINLANKSSKFNVGKAGERSDLVVVTFSFVLRKLNQH
jgi:hypothetical protein